MRIIYLRGRPRLSTLYALLSLPRWMDWLWRRLEGAL